ncbi:hypothetical protein CR513_08327, partial [Mucuna pruriens]
MLCFSLGGKKAETIYASPYYMTHCQNGPLQVHFRKANVDRVDSTLGEPWLNNKPITLSMNTTLSYMNS